VRRASAIRRQSAGLEGQPAGRGNVIGERVRQARQRQSLTMLQLCERVEAQAGYEFHQSTLTRIEQGIRSVYDFEVIILSLALETDVRVLLGLMDVE